MDKLIPFMPWIASLLALACAAAALRSDSRKRLIQTLPTSETDGVFMGLVELKGTAESEQPLRSRLAEVPCVHYQWRVEEEWRRTSTSTDSSGKTTPRTVQNDSHSTSMTNASATGVKRTRSWRIISTAACFTWAAPV